MTSMSPRSILSLVAQCFLIPKLANGQAAETITRVPDSSCFLSVKAATNTPSPVNINAPSPTSVQGEKLTEMVNGALQRISQSQFENILYSQEFLKGLTALTAIPNFLHVGAGEVQKAAGANCTFEARVNKVSFNENSDGKAKFDNLELRCKESDAVSSYVVKSLLHADHPLTLFPLQVDFETNLNILPYPANDQIGCTEEVLGKGKACAGILLQKPVVSNLSTKETGASKLAEALLEKISSFMDNQGWKLLSILSPPAIAKKQSPFSKVSWHTGSLDSAGPDDPVDVSPLMVLAMNQVFPLNVPSLIERLTNGTNPLEVKGKDFFINTCSVDVKWKLQPELAVVSSDIEAFIYLDTLSTPPKITFESRSDISLKGVNKDETTVDWTHINWLSDCEPNCGAHADNSFPEGTWYDEGIGGKKCLCISRVTGVENVARRRGQVYKYKMGKKATRRRRRETTSSHYYGSEGFQLSVRKGCELFKKGPLYPIIHGDSMNVFIAERNMDGADEPIVFHIPKFTTNATLDGAALSVDLTGLINDQLFSYIWGITNCGDFNIGDGNWVTWPEQDEDGMGGSTNCNKVEVDGMVDIFPGIRDLVKAQWDKLSKRIPNPWVISLDGGETREV